MTNIDYDTTFSKEIELKMSDYISANFLEEIAEIITKRVPKNDVGIELSLKTNIGADFSTSSWNAVEKILEESKKFNRTIDVIQIKTGIVHKDKESKTHYSVELRIQRIQEKFHGYLRVYAVAGSVAESQHVIDWGAGLIKDFEQLNINEKDLPDGTMIISAEDGSIRGFVKTEPRYETPQKVEVVNSIDVIPPKWSEKNVVLNIVGIAVAIILPLIGWLFFQTKP